MREKKPSKFSNNQTEYLPNHSESEESVEYLNWFRKQNKEDIKAVDKLVGSWVKLTRKEYPNSNPIAFLAANSKYWKNIIEENRRMNYSAASYRVSKKL